MHSHTPKHWFGAHAREGALQREVRAQRALAGAAAVTYTLESTAVAQLCTPCPIRPERSRLHESEAAIARRCHGTIALAHGGQLRLQ